MTAKNHKSVLDIADREYLKALKPELRRAIESGDVERAATYAKAIARLHRKRLEGKQKKNGGCDV